MKKVRAKAYCSSANLGSGFDIVAIALNAYYDVVEAEVEKSNKSIVEVISVEGIDSNLVKGVNTAKLAVEKLLSITKVNAYVRLRIIKGIPVGKGLGSSGASAVAAVVAVANGLNLNVDVSTLLMAAGYGEIASANTVHYDNVAASLLGGLTVVIPGSKPYAVSLGKPPAVFVLSIPKIPVIHKKTGFMRNILPKHISLKQHVFNSGRLAALLAGIIKKDLKLFTQGIGDSIVEPARAPYIPCYYEVKEAALKSGALGITISGAGPSILAVTNTYNKAYSVVKAIHEKYRSCGIETEIKITTAADGAKIIL